MKECTHTNQIREVQPHTRGCEECLKMGDSWVHLRLCLTCGHVGCCEDSEHTHALKHFNSTGHPIIAALDRAENWAWCYVHRKYSDLAPTLRPKRRSPLAAFFGRFFGG